MVQEKVCWCTGVRVFFWNEKLTRNQISEEEGLCVIIIRRKYQRVHPCPCYYSSCFRFYQDSCSTAIPFDLSMLINKDPSLFLSATLQFTPKYIIPMSHTISSHLFSRYPHFPQSPAPYMIVALEITQDFIDDSTHCSLFLPPSTPIPSFSRFQKDWDVEEEHRTSACSLSTTDYMMIHMIATALTSSSVYALREYTGEGGICPAKPPIAPDLPKGLSPLKPSPSPSQTPIFKFNDYIGDLMDDTCPVCYGNFKNKKEVITTNCMHCLLTWLSKNNTCPICRAVIGGAQL